ncbi:MAG: TIGR02147 family protein [SAR324 cluster bacterium]|nr:TIGR02147 family protein [SAR324 cluster bacterium]
MRLELVCPNLYEYLDYRTLLRDYFDGCRKKSSKYSMRFFAKRLGFGSPNYIQRILAGERKLSENTLDGLIEMLELKGTEQEYFELLVKMEQTKDIKRRNQYFNQISSIRRRKIKVTTLDEAQYACISSWIHWVIREISFLNGPLENVQWILRHLRVKVSASVITRCLKDLETAGLLMRQNENLKAAMSSINFPEEVYSLALLNYHQQILEQSIQALHEQSADEREYGAILAATTPEKYQLAKEKMKKFRREMLELLDTQEGEASRVINFSFQLFQVVDDVNVEPG